ncbi:enoyl-CoA hydratase/isomerase family protein [Nakamurella sp. YIM 132087]|uniref:Enoyl-CoA hydratase/isomerase family protein n=1 Tax=Nakamurella alba TaxID=2665158 RepID=A0A7K1FEG4_9ACTN|nr:enoyl-CoA hydratase-related protein [Nakamurella alba]MTD12495.1 enoyl-CoA hydratase/isomerase family protein [Nakamurella alba]
MSTPELSTPEKSTTEETSVLRNYTPPELETLSLEVLPGGVVVLSIDRPDRMNSMTIRMFEEFGIVADALRDTGARAMILRGAGEKVFCAGFDLDEVGVLPSYGIREFLAFQEMATGGIAALRQSPFPIIAAIHGAAVGGGMALALAADIRLAAPTARFSAAFTRIGFSVGDLGTSWLLQRLIGPARTAELAFTARMVESDEAERIGLVNRIVPSADLMDEALTIAGQISANSPGGVRMSKRALHRNQEIGSYAAALELENRGQALLTRGSDMPEALSAFKEKRAPVFTGR